MNTENFHYFKQKNIEEIFGNNYVKKLGHVFKKFRVKFTWNFANFNITNINNKKTGNKINTSYLPLFDFDNLQKIKYYN